MHSFAYLFFPIFCDFSLFQLKYLEKGEFRDLNYVKTIRLDGNQLSVIIDNLFETQRYLEYLGNKFSYSKKYSSKLNRLLNMS